MAFPQSPLDVRVSIAPGADPAGNMSGWTWVDISDDVRVKSGVDITQGRADEGKKVDPGKCSLVVNNATGNYSPRNPVGAYYGDLAKNTPLKVDVGLDWVNDGFNRANRTDGWGTADNGSLWGVRWRSSGSYDATEYGITSNKGYLKIPAVSNWRSVALFDTEWIVDADVQLDATVGVMPTGDNFEIGNIAMRGTTPSTGYLFRTTISPAGVVAVTIFDPAGNTLAAATVPSLTFTIAKTLRIRAQLINTTLSMKVWDASTAEPGTWLATATDSTNTGPGVLAVRAGLATGVTNVLPITFNHDNIVIKVWANRFVGNVVEWPPRWDKSGNDAWMPITAAGVLRRISQGVSPVDSTMHRAHSFLGPVAYWPLEGEGGATRFADYRGGKAGTYSGTPVTAGGKPAEGSAEIVKMSADSLIYFTPKAYTTSSTAWTMSFIFLVPSNPATDTSIMDIYTTGTIAKWQFAWSNIVFAGPAYGTYIRYTPAGGSPTNSGIITGFEHMTDGSPFGKYILVNIVAQQSGGNIVLTSNWWSPSKDDTTTTLGAATATVAGTIGRITRIQVSDDQPHQDWEFGHVAMYDSVQINVASALDGFRFESVEDRIFRVADGVGIPITVDAGTDGIMGPQSIDTALNILRECEDADGGLFIENGNGLRYLPRVSRYAQPVMMDLDFAQGHVAEPPEPTDDDQNLRNDVTVKRKGGSSSRFIIEDGPNAVARVGRYDEEVTLNLGADDVLEYHAGWRAHLGSVDEMRWPRINLNMAGRPAVISDWLACRIGSRVTVANTPAQVAPDFLDLFLEGYQERLSIYGWDVVINASPARPQDVFVVEDPWLGRISPDDARTLEAISSTATTLPVMSFVGGPKFTTAAADLPMDILVAGEEMTVTAVTDVAVSFRGVGAAASGDNATLNPALPASLQAGDLMLLLAGSRADGVGSPDTPAGWDQIETINDTVKLFARYYVVGDTAPSVSFTGTVSGDSTGAQICAFRGTSASILKSVQGSNGTQQNIDLAALSAAQEPYTVALAVGWKKTSWTSVAPLSGFTEIGEVNVTAGNDMGMVWDYQLQDNESQPYSATSFTVTGGTTAAGRSKLLMLRTGVQRLTVTRSVNGVVKSIPAGSQVELWKPGYLAL